MGGQEGRKEKGAGQKQSRAGAGHSRATGEERRRGKAEAGQVRNRLGAVTGARAGAGQVTGARARQ